MEIEVNLGIPMLLLIGGAVGVLAICFKMKPAEKKGEGGKYKLADTEESDVIDESDPLATAEKVWQHDEKTWKKNAILDYKVDHLNPPSIFIDCTTAKHFRH